MRTHIPDDASPDPANGLLRFLLLLICFALMAGCGGGGGGSEDDEGPDDPVETGPAQIKGAWVGTASRTSNNSQSDALLLADVSGDTMLYVALGSDTFTVRGNACCDGLVDGPAEAWSFFGKISTPSSVHLNVTDLISGARSISGSVTVEGIEYTLALNLIEDFKDPLTAASLAGHYTRTTSGGTTITVDITTGGALSGGDSTGCQFSGQVSIPSAAENLFEIDSLTLSQCPAQAAVRNGNYTGLGHLADSEGGTDDTLMFLATGPVEFALILPVKAPTSIAPQVSLNATSTSVEYGETATLLWSTQNASGCTATQGWSGAKNSAGGQEITAALTATTTFELSCSGSAGAPAASTSLTVNVVPLPADPAAGGTSTVAGVDSNSNGLRDDIERYLLTEYPAGVTRDTLAARGKILGVALTAPPTENAAQDVNLDLFRNLECLVHVAPDQVKQVSGELLARMLNTADRLRAYLVMDQAAAGQVIQLRSEADIAAACGGTVP